MKRPARHIQLFPPHQSLTKGHLCWQCQRESRTGTKTKVTPQLTKFICAECKPLPAEAGA